MNRHLLISLLTVAFFAVIFVCVAPQVFAEDTVPAVAIDTKPIPATDEKSVTTNDSKQEPACDVNKTPASDGKQEPASVINQTPESDKTQDPAKATNQEPASDRTQEPDKDTNQAPASETKQEPAKDTGTAPASDNTPAAKLDDKTTKMLGGTPDKNTLTPEEQRFVELLNATRKEHHLAELQVAPLLVKIAREKSQEMHDLDYWGHVSPIAAKRTAMRRVLFYLPQPPITMTVGENLYFCGKVLVEEGHTALMKSPTHRANILKPEYQYIGIGTYIGSDKRFWTTQIFVKAQY